MDNVQLLTVILTIVVGIIVMLAVILAMIFFYSKMKKNDEKKIQTNNKATQTIEKKIGKTKRFKEYKVESIMNFMEFDTIVDNMISQKDGMRYIMVVECQGINYDLMSQVEKNSVEESFVQFLNTLRYPVQIYVQTRTINLDNSIETYKKKIEEFKNDLEKEERRFNDMKRSGRYSQEQLNKEFFEVTKKKNLYDYGRDVVYNTERMSKNRNVLNQKYYVIIPYFIEDLDNDNYDKLEQRNYAFSELYTRAQAVIRTLSSCGISGRILDSNGLVELLYMAYNRDEAETYGIDKALRAGYDELYSTAPDVIEKQIKALDQEIQEQAIEMAKKKVDQVKSEKRKILEEKKTNKNQLIEELAKLVIEENSPIIGEDIAKEAVKQIGKKKKANEGGKKENDELQKTKRTRKTKTT